MHGGHQGRERITRDFGPPTDDESWANFIKAPKSAIKRPKKRFRRFIPVFTVFLSVNGFKRGDIGISLD